MLNVCSWLTSEVKGTKGAGLIVLLAGACSRLSNCVILGFPKGRIYYGITIGNGWSGGGVWSLHTILSRALALLWDHLTDALVSTTL